MSEKIWYEDLQGFMTLDNYYVILPMSNMTFEEKLNSLVRFFIYLGLLLALIKANYKYLFFGIIAALVSVIITQFEKSQKQKAEKFLEKKDLAVVDNTVCVRSTVDNPFMNPSVADIAYNPSRPSACSLDHPAVQNQIDKNFNARLYRDVGDLYGKMSSQREFYTVPSTTIPNDQGGFAEWLYGTGPTCKEGEGLSCTQNIYRTIAS
jgi:hypothetical protein